MNDVVLYSVADGVATLTLNRPDQLNAFTADMHAGLLAGIARVAADDNVRCLVITGAGRGFCAGEDLREAMKSMGAGGIDYEGILRERYRPVVLGLQQLPKPVIAAVNGVAAGAGVSLALACDIRLAADNARFMLAFSKIGLIPDAGANWFLPRVVGIGRALELAMTGGSMDAAKAEATGLVNHVFPADEFADRVKAYAAELAQGATAAMGFAKQAIYYGLSHDLAATLAEEGRLQARAGATADHQEGVQAFVEKRPPVFRGR